MKKIFSIMMLALSATFVFTSCNDDDVEYVSEQQNALPVISRETSFPASASQGTIVLETTAPLTVTTDAGQWISTSVDGNKVNVSVSANSSFDGRTAMLKITDGSKVANVAVIQAGCILDLGGVNSISRNDNAATLSYPVKENCSPVISSDADWIHAELAEGVLSVKIDANKSGMVRRGNVIYTVGDLEGKIPVVQGDFAKDIAGQYVLYYVDGKNKQKNTTATVKKSGVNYYLDIFDLSIPVVYSATDHTITWLGGQYVADYTYKDEKCYIATLVFDSVSGYLTWGKYGLAAPVTTETIDGQATSVLRFKDDGSWGSRVADSFMLELFNSKTSFTGTTRLKVQHKDTMTNPYLVKVTTSNAPAL